MDGRDKTLGDNLKKTKFACLVEAARAKSRESGSINLNVLKPGKIIEPRKDRKPVVEKKVNNHEGRALFTANTIAKYVEPEKNDGFEPGD